MTKKASKKTPAIATMSPADQVKAIQEEAAKKIAALLDDLKTEEATAIDNLRTFQQAILDAGGAPEPYTVPGGPPPFVLSNSKAAPSTRRKRSSGGSLKVSILGYLAEHESATADDIVNGTGAAKNSINATLSALAKEGLISKPARGLNSITPAGKKELQSA